MNIKINNKTKNNLLKREEIDFEVDHKNSPTPPREEVLSELSEEINVQKGLIVIEKVSTPQGRQVASGIARVYESRDQLEEVEPEYLLERTGIKDIEVEEKTEKPEEEKEETEESAQEDIEEEKEEIDYEEISSKTISEIKEKSKEKDLDYEKLLKAEKDNKDRKTLKKWLKNKI